MIRLLSKILIKNHKNYQDTEVRTAYGMLCGAVGVFFNILLFVGKFFAGTISHSVSITADAFNNLSDAGSSVITLVGFKLAGQKPDPEHPFGHGRIEYLTGLVVAMAILLMGYELLTSSIDKIIHPQQVEMSTLSVAILIASIAIKFYMCLYNTSIGKKISSTTMKAVAADSLSDCVATTVVLIATLAGHFTGLALDGWCGVLVSLFILKTGFSAAKDTISPLLGQKPDEELVNRIYHIVMDHEEVLGMHDLIVHDYGPGRLMVTLHAEVSANEDFLYTHDVIDNIENELKEKLGCEATIHMDPISYNDETVNNMRMRVAQKVCDALGECVSIHDFRMVEGHSHTNIIFDVVIPCDYKLSVTEVETKVIEAVAELDNGYYNAVVKVEYAYI